MNKPKTKRTKRSIAIDIIGIVLTLLILPIFIINLSMTIQTVMDPNAIPSFRGHTPLIHSTESMVPVFDSSDLVIVEYPDDPAALKEGEIISFLTDGVIITHRIVDVVQDENGHTAYVTQGDANNAPDTLKVYPDHVIGVYEKHYDGLAPFALFLQTPKGLILCSVLPAFLFIAIFAVRDRLAHWRDVKELAKMKEEAARREQMQDNQEEVPAVSVSESAPAEPIE